jgi:hypothetical protein
MSYICGRYLLVKEGVAWPVVWCVCMHACVHACVCVHMCKCKWILNSKLTGELKVVLKVEFLKTIGLATGGSTN